MSAINKSNSEIETTEKNSESLTEYKETIYATNSKSKKKTKGKNKKNPVCDEEQRYWRDVKKIEENIDNIHISHAQRPSSELDRSVDRLIEKNKK